MSTEHDPIFSFTGDYAFLSNFYPAVVRYGGWTYPSVEHAYQAAKCGTNRVYQARFRVAPPFPSRTPTAAQAKRMGRAIALPHDWDEKKVDLMRSLLRSKFNPTTNARLRGQLVATRGRHLVEGNNWGDRFWGVFEGVGENWLGRLLMEIRG